jgi:type IX secretion system PorP/SprF family membrane protein
MKHISPRFVIQGLMLFVLASGECLGQKGVLYEQYVQNPMAINPAFTGTREAFNMTAMLRRKWFRIQGATSSQTFAGDGAFGNNKFGVGFQALNDQTSSFSTVGAYGSFAYHLTVSDEWKLSLGAQGGVNVIPVYDGVGGYAKNKAFGSFGLGAWLRSEQFYVGISKPEVLAPRLGGQGIYVNYRRPLFVMIGGNHQIDDDLLLLPHLLIVQEKYYKLRADAGVRLWVKEKIGLGASYRIGGARDFVSSNVNYLQLSAEVQVGKNVRFGYFYGTRQIEIPVSYNGPQGIHELMMKFTPNPVGFQKN